MDCARFILPQGDTGGAIIRRTNERGTDLPNQAPLTYRQRRQEKNGRS